MHHTKKDVRTMRVNISVGSKAPKRYRIPAEVFAKLRRELRNYELKAQENDALIDWRSVMQREIPNFSDPGTIIKASRHKVGLTQVELASKLRITQGNLSAMERGHRPVGKIIARRLAKIFEVDYRVFL